LRSSYEGSAAKQILSLVVFAFGKEMMKGAVSPFCWPELISRIPSGLGFQSETELYTSTMGGGGALILSTHILFILVLVFLMEEERESLQNSIHTEERACGSGGQRYSEL
jgi:hypothetical protein